MTRRELLAFPVCALPALAAPESHVYKTVDGRALRLTVVRAEHGSGRRPTAVFYHGGGWTGGKPTQFDKHSEHLARRGMTCVQVEYRLLGAKTAEPPETCIADALDAMRWVRAHAAELGADPRRVAAGGGSAGGHLAAYLGVMAPAPVRPNAMLLFNPVFDNGPDGWGYARTGKRYMEFSPLHNVAQGAPPAIVFVGSQDKLLPVKTVEEFQRRMRAAGSKCEIRVYDGQPHGFFNWRAEGNPYFDKTVAEMDQFLVGLGWLKAK